MTDDQRQIIELEPEKPDDGEIRYTFSTTPPKVLPSGNFLNKIFGLFLGIGLLLLFIFFFIYVILPLIAILLIWMLVRNLLRKA